MGRVDGDRFYDGSGRQMGRMDGERLYDGSGRQIGRGDGVRRRQMIVFFYFFM
ncbi:MAG: 5-fold beta-flower protein [Sphingobacteriales bacterium]